MAKTRKFNRGDRVRFIGYDKDELKRVSNPDWPAVGTIMEVGRLIEPPDGYECWPVDIPEDSDECWPTMWPQERGLFWSTELEPLE